MSTFLGFQNIRSFSVGVAKLVSGKNALGGKNLISGVAITENGRTIVAWHPDVKTPYECTKPIPKSVASESGTLIKEAAINSAMRAFKEKNPEVARQELMQLTHTTKHRWFPRARDKKAKQDTPMDRPYL